MIIKHKLKIWSLIKKTR